MNGNGSPANVGSNAGLGPAAEAHWYCLASNGIATLCVDMADAANTAKMCDEQYPKYAPHRAVMLGDVAAERERCAKLVESMDTTGHDGFIETTGDLCEALAARIRRA